MLLKVHLQNTKEVKAVLVMCFWNTSPKRCKAVNQNDALNVTNIRKTMLRAVSRKRSREQRSR